MGYTELPTNSNSGSLVAVIAEGTCSTTSGVAVIVLNVNFRMSELYA